MKRLILLILILCTLTSCAKKNEEFVIRNGIKFGMSKEEVLGKENSPVYYINFDDTNTGQFNVKDIVFDMDVNISYEFVDNELVSMMYSMAEFTHEAGNDVNEYPPMYNEIDKALSSKYGASYYNGKEASNIDISDYTNQTTQWFVPNNSKSVEIKHEILWVGETKYIYHRVYYINHDESYKNIINTQMNNNAKF